MAATATDPRAYAYAAAAYAYIQKRCHDEPDPDAVRQRELTGWSFAVLRTERPDVQLFTGRLIQFDSPGEDHPGQIAPDHFVAVHPTPLGRWGGYNIPYEPVRPLLVMNYVAESDRKYDAVRREMCERDLAVPYYLRFDLTGRDLALFRPVGGTYRAARANPAGRLAVPELELEVALLDGWVRFWFRGELLPRPEDLLRERRAMEAELARLREELAEVKGSP
jgi:hypothetical protein